MDFVWYYKSNKKQYNQINDAEEIKTIGDRL